MGSEFVIVRVSPDELKHHGIKGQKWGNRRFQNEDGSYTEAGKDRYGFGDNSKIENRYKRGKAYSKEQESVKNQEYEKSKKNSKAYQALDYEAKRLNKKYGFEEDEDDPFGFDRHDNEPVDPFEKNAAKNRYYNIKLTKESMEAKFKDEATKKSGEHMAKKYGDTYVSDLKHYEKRSALHVIGIAAAIPTAVFIGTKIAGAGKPNIPKANI